MALYVYGCPACEIEIEERRPIVEADMPVVCPICHEFCVREVSSFSIGVSAREPNASVQARLPAPVRHGAGCDCCR